MELKSILPPREPRFLVELTAGELIIIREALAAYYERLAAPFLASPGIVVPDGTTICVDGSGVIMPGQPWPS